MSFATKYGVMKRSRMAEGGMCEHGSSSCPECHGDDQASPPVPVAGSYAEGGLVERIMKKRNGEPEADEMSADFDYLDQRSAGDEANYTGENSGDELGNAELDENDADLIRRIMRSRAKRDRNPRPA